MLIRRENPEDYETVYSVIKEAFAHAEHADGNEPDLVNSLRVGSAFISELSLIAEIDGRIAGHILFTKAKVGDNTVLALAPLSVLPEYQRQGVGTALIREGHRIARELGYRYSVVLGSAAYYPKEGYLPAATFGITPSFDVPLENFMAYKLDEEAPDIYGVMKYAGEFGIV
ncbi:MAG: N-acetyltransferase [Lachnospiraceae bacterium]|nr:N-acetyltransferase [Lachnospiraceae bacterium]